MAVDLVIRGAFVIDGTGAVGVEADVAVAGDRIVAIERDGVASGAIDVGETTTVVDGAGRALAPGFIDTHTHDDFAVAVHPDMGFKVQGGVTTCVVGNCGLGAAPWSIASLSARAFHPDHELPQWDGYGGYLDWLDQHPPSVNVAALVGHGTVRGAVMGGTDAAPAPDQLASMREIVAEGMAAGCIGMSTGLIYVPGSYATTDEIVALATVVAEAGGLYTSHIRDEGDGLLDAVDEAITIGREARLPVVISHLKATGPANWGKVIEALDRIDAAGPTVAADQYPYTAGSTILSAIAGGGRGLGAAVDPAATVIASTDDHPQWHGRSLEELAAELDVAPADAARIVLDAEPTATVILHTMSEDDVRTIMAHPGIMIGSDGLPTLAGQPHPRLYGTFARVIGHYGRDLGLLTLEESIHRMTGRSAAVFGLVDRGEIRPGAYADLVLFDPATIIDVGTYTDPHHPPRGIDGVWVNGVRVVDAGLHLGTRPGRTVRRPGS